MTEDGWFSQEQKDAFLGVERLEEYDFKYMRSLLTKYGIAAPESDEELGNNWGSYLRKLERLVDEESN